MYFIYDEELLQDVKNQYVQHSFDFSNRFIRKIEGIFAYFEWQAMILLNDAPYQYFMSVDDNSYNYCLSSKP